MSADNAQTGGTADLLLDRMESLADEIADPMRCRQPGYGAPGRAHCAACCYGTGYVITCAEDEAMLKAAQALTDAVRLIRSTQLGREVDHG